MLDKIFYKFFSILDDYSNWIDKFFTKPKKKKEKKNVKKTTR